MPLHKVSVSPMEITTATSAPYTAPAKVVTMRASSPEHSSQTSSVTSNGFDICRICHCEGDAEVPLIAPCYCAGSLRYVHQACLQQWIKSSNIRCCELCKFQFVMQTKTKPFREWEHLEMTANERRKLLCAVLFHAVALTCVIWSLYVLIDRTLDEIHTGILEWPFWTKLIVVAIGFTGGVVFMYIQCKAYLHIYQRWKAYNLVIYVQNAPEKPSLPSPQFAIKSEAQPVHIDLPPHLCTATPSYEHASMWEETNEAPPTFDISKFKNLHIFFNEEDTIPPQKDEQESRLVDYLEAGGEPNNFGRSNIFGNAKPGEQDKMNAVRKTWHIQIEKGVVGPDIAKAIDNRTYEEVVKANLMEPRPYRSEDFQLGRNNEGKDTTPPVLNLQINKADNIVITIGGTNDDHAAKSGDSLADAGSDTINKTKVDMEKKSNSNDDEGSEDSLSGCGSPTCRLLPSRPKAYPFDKRQSPVDSETGSQYPLLAQTTNSKTN